MILGAFPAPVVMKNCFRLSRWKDNQMAKHLVFEIADDDEKPQTLHVTLVAATQMEFSISHAGKDYEEVIKDICAVAPSMMSYDSDLMEAFDDAFRTQPKQLDKINIYKFIKKYDDALSDLDIDFLEDN
jgi:hypothetical protein